MVIIPTPVWSLWEYLVLSLKFSWHSGRLFFSSFEPHVFLSGSLLRRPHHRLVTGSWLRRLRGNWNMEGFYLWAWSSCWCRLVLVLRPPIPMVLLLPSPMVRRLLEIAWFLISLTHCSEVVCGPYSWVRLECHCCCGFVTWVSPGADL